MNRRKAREIAFTFIFEYRFQPDRVEENIRVLPNMYPDAEEQKGYIEDVVSGFAKNVEVIDGKIAEMAKGWPLSRLSSVSLACMRLGLYEILFREDIPNPIAIDEALHLVRKFEGEEAIGFVNGVLGRFEKG